MTTQIEDTDLASPEAVTAAAYRLISFKPGGAPRWASFKRLFAEHCVLALRVFPGDPAITVMSLDDYVQVQIREGMKESGYVERPVDQSVTVTGEIAEVRVRFQMVFGPDEVFNAIDVFQLVFRAGRWWIVSILSEVLTKANAA